MAIKVKKPAGIKPISASPRINMMLYGHPGAGKTRFVGTSGDKTLIIKPPTDHLDSIIGRFHGEVWEINDWERMFEALEYLRDSKGGGYEWVWLDSISLFQDTGLDDIWAGVVAAKPHRKQHGLDRGEYGVNMFRLGQWVRHIVGAGYFNFGITAHPAEMPSPFDDDDEGGFLVMPYIQGKNMSSKICGYMNIVARLHVRTNKAGKEVRVMETNHTDRFYGKDQYDALPNGRMVSPSVPKLMTAIEASISNRSQE